MDGTQAEFIKALGPFGQTLSGRTASKYLQWAGHFDSEPNLSVTCFSLCRQTLQMAFGRPLQNREMAAATRALGDAIFTEAFFQANPEFPRE